MNPPVQRHNERLMREIGLQKKAKTIGYAVCKTLRLKAIERQDRMCGKATFDQRATR